MNSAPKEGLARFFLVGISAENDEMLARPFDFAGDEVPHPTAGVTEFLAFREEEFTGALLFVAEGVVDGERDLVGDEGEIADLLGGIGIGVACTEAEAAEAAIRGGEGKDASGVQTRLLIVLH